MEAFNAYLLYLALKKHFTSSYDYHKYQGKMKVSFSAFERRNDKAFFYKLAKHKDLEGYLVSTLISKGDMWVGDMINNPDLDDLYTQWKRTQESFMYVFMNEVQDLPSLKESISVVGGQHPLLLRRVLSQTTRIETMIALNEVIRFIPSWNAKIADPVIWPDLRFKCLKYKPFLKLDRDKLEEFIIDHVDANPFVS